MVSHYYKPLQGAQNQWEKLAGTKIFKNVCILEHPIMLLSGELELIELTVANALLKVTHVTVLVENDDGPCLWHVRV